MSSPDGDVGIPGGAAVHPAREALRSYPRRPPAKGMLIMLAGILVILAGMVISPDVSWLGGGIYLSGLVWYGVAYRYWKTGYLRVLLASNQEVLDALPGAVKASAREDTTKEDAP